MNSSGAVLVLLVTPLLVGACGLFSLRWARGDFKKRSPVSRKVARYPGYSLSVRIERLSDSFELTMLVLILTPVVIVVFGGLGLLEGLSRPLSIPMGVLVLTVLSVVFWRSYQTASALLNCRAGLRGEKIVGNELSRLWRDGYQVFHDFPLEFGNIDHIAVGPGGVFAIETKYVRKEKGRKDGHIVRLEGDTLLFPNRSSKSEILQAERQALELERKLEKLFGPVPVNPVLVFPGWFIDWEAGKSQILVGNGKTVIKALARRQAELPKERVKVIAAYLRERCSDVEV